MSALEKNIRYLERLKKYEENFQNTLNSGDPKAISENYYAFHMFLIANKEYSKADLIKNLAIKNIKEVAIPNAKTNEDLSAIWLSLWSIYMWSRDEKRLDYITRFHAICAAEAILAGRKESIYSSLSFVERFLKKQGKHDLAEKVRKKRYELT